jgi:hypothetical protein
VFSRRRVNVPTLGLLFEEGRGRSFHGGAMFAAP